MNKGGYQIINLNDVNHPIGVGVVHEGIYDKIKGTRKAILLSGIVIDNLIYNDMFVSTKKGGTTYFMCMNSVERNNCFIISVSNTNVVTINEF